MSYHNLSDFLSELQDDGELRRVRVEVDPVLEVSEIVDRLCKVPGGGPALLFERVRGSTIPLVVNLLGSQKRLCRALGVRSFDQVAQRGAGMLKPDAPGNWFQKLKLLPASSEATSWPPQIIKTGACQQVVKIGRDVDLDELPALKHWPRDAGRFLTSGQVYTRHPVTLERHLESFPLQIRDRNSLGVHWNLHHEAFRVFREHQARGTQTPVAIAFGGSPLWYYLTTVPVPRGFDRLTYGGILGGRSLELVKCRQIDLEVPAQAEIVLEGYIDPTEPPEPGGHCAGRSGYYRQPEEVVTLHVTAVTHRSNPILVGNLPGHPPMEQDWIEQANSALLLPWLRLAAPEVVDYHVPRRGGDSRICFVSIHKSYPLQARKVMQAIWSLQQTMFSKIVVVVDEHVDLKDEDGVWLQVAANTHPGRDVLFHEGPGSMEDHAAPVRGVGHKMGIDATRKLSEENHPRPWPEELEIPRGVKELVTGRWAEYDIGADPGETRQR